MTDAEKKHIDTVVFTAPESGLYQFSDGKITLTKRIGENCIYCSELCSDLMRDEHRIKTLEARVEKLREALEFYGDREETRESFDQLDWDLVNNNAALQDRGKRARAALKEDEEMG